MEEHVVLPVQLQQAALERPLFRVEGMDRIDGIVMVAARGDIGKAELLFPAAVQKQPADLPAQKK